MPEENKKQTYWLVFLLVGSCIFSIFISFYFYAIKKEHNFFVETACDTTKENCFYRDCESEDAECPPNNLSYYSKYSIRAKDFPMCVNEDCADFCTSQQKDSCIKIACTQEELDFGECVYKADTIIDDETDTIDNQKL
jgi:hypothetical protein